jgi:hypothetical protein
MEEKKRSGKERRGKKREVEDRRIRRGSKEKPQLRI